MSKLRIVAIVFAGALFSMLVDAAIDREWPHFTAAGLLVFVGGLALLSLAFIALESRRNR